MIITGSDQKAVIALTCGGEVPAVDKGFGS